ncbi:MAG: Hsp20/alpha crystallin family protein [Candidatus Omnitrophica bacterium]|nr:Hsp20/alpha crystallin family protein [Candidatus Omnitrophota bacterium]
MKLIPRQSDSWLVNPLTEVEGFDKEMNSLFDFSLTRDPFETGRGFLADIGMPAIDIHDLKDSLLIKADLPGLTKEEMHVSFEEGQLIIQGEKKKEHETKEGNYHRRERYYGSFYRSIALPSIVDAKKAEAQYKDGVLEVRLPKTEESRQKQITIHVK